MSKLLSMTRGVSPALLVLTALCFLLPFVGVACNTTAAQAPLGAALQQLGGSGAQSVQVNACLQALKDRDLATYSGTNLVLGSKPSAATDIPGCSGSGSSGSAEDQSTVGVQPMLVMALILIAIGAVAAVLRAPLRALVAAGAALVAAILVVITALTVHSAITSKLSSSAGSSLSSLGVTSIDPFFNVHPAIGFWLILLALLLAIVVNGASLLLGAREPRAAAAPPPPAGGGGAHWDTPSPGPPPPG